jgi:hypothetical protein
MATANIVKFPKAKRNIPTNYISDVTHRYIAHGHKRFRFLPWCGQLVINVLDFLIECLRTIVLTLLLWFRPILFVVCRPLSGLLLIAFIVCLFTHPHDQHLTYGFGILCFCTFLIMYLYDGILVFLSRGNIVNILN